MLTPPRYATKRDPSRPTYGGHTAAIAAHLGRPLIPWQRYVADVAGEIDPDTGMLVYSKIFVTVQRQAGKTDLDFSAALQNAFLGPNRRGWYTAQSGQHASSKWREYVEKLDATPNRIKRLSQTYLGKGSERLILPGASEFAPHPPSPESLHSKQSDRNTIDEAWAFTQDAGAALLQAIVPTTTTRRMLVGQQPQLWLISAEGTAESTFWNPEIDAARDDAPPNVAVFDWGLRPDDDPDDLAVVASRHPGFGYLLDMETLEDARSKLTSPTEFARAYGNRRTSSERRMIPEAEWQAAAWLDPIPDTATDFAFGAAGGVDGVDAAVAVATLLEDGTVIVAIVDQMHRPGTHWAGAAVADLTARFGQPAAIDNVGPSAGIYADAQRAGATLVDVTTSTATAALSGVLSGLRNPDGPTWRHKPHAALDAAVEIAAKRYVGDGGFLIGRRASIGSVAALEAAVMATHAVLNKPRARGLQLF